MLYNSTPQPTPTLEMRAYSISQRITRNCPDPLIIGQIDS